MKGDEINVQLMVDFMDEWGLTNTAFCKLCGITNKSLKKALSGDTDLRICVYIRIAHATDIPLDKLMGWNFTPRIKSPANPPL